MTCECLQFSSPGVGVLFQSSRPVIDPGPAAWYCWQVATTGLPDLWPQDTAAGLTRLVFKRWKLSITRWVDAHQRECINQYTGEVFFFPNNKSSCCTLPLFFCIQSNCCIREASWVCEDSVVRQPYHKQSWSTTLCHPGCDPGERCLGTFWQEFMEN